MGSSAWNRYDISVLTKTQILERREAILQAARRHGAYDVRLFGSVARGDATDRSDVDLIVTFDPGRTLMDHAALIGDLEDLLGAKVDVIDADGMRPRFRAVVEREAVAL